MNRVSSRAISSEIDKYYISLYTTKVYKYIIQYTSF